MLRWIIFVALPKGLIVFILCFCAAIIIPISGVGRENLNSLAPIMVIMFFLSLVIAVGFAWPTADDKHSVDWKRWVEKE